MNTIVKGAIKIPHLIGEWINYGLTSSKWSNRIPAYFAVLLIGWVIVELVMFAGSFLLNVF